MLSTMEFQSRGQLFSYLNDKHCDISSPTLNLFILLPQKNINADKVKKKAKSNGISCEMIKKTDDLFLMTIGIRKAYDTGYLLVNKDYWIFITDKESSKVSSIINSFVMRTFPLLSLSYIKSDELLELIDSLSKRYESVNFLDGTLTAGSNTFRHWKREPFPFSSKKIKKISDREKSKWKAISFSSCLNGNEIKARIYDKGHLSLYKGNFNDFYEHILMNYISIALGIKNLFTNKERKIRNKEVIVNMRARTTSHRSHYAIGCVHYRLVACSANFVSLGGHAFRLVGQV